MEAYRNAREWSEFKNIVEEDENYEEDLTGYDWDLVESEYSDNASIDAIKINSEAFIECIYGINGQLIRTPADGVNIIKYTDGTSRKIIR